MKLSVLATINGFLIKCSLTKDLHRERKKVQAQKRHNAKAKAIQAELRNARNTIAKLRKQHKIDIKKMMRSHYHMLSRKALFSVIITNLGQRVRLAFERWRGYTNACRSTIISIAVCDINPKQRHRA